jgi:hypothetical protein
METDIAKKMCKMAVVDFGTLPAYPPPKHLNIQGMMVFLSLSKALDSRNP